MNAKSKTRAQQSLAAKPQPKPVATKMPQSLAITPKIRAAFDAFMTGKNFMTAYRIWQGRPEKPMYVTQGQQAPLRAAFVALGKAASWKALKQARKAQARRAAKPKAERAA
jgi:hypothetical protein